MSETESVELLRKMAPRTVLGAQPEKPEKATKLYTVFGVAEELKQGESTYGPWVALRGDFEAVRISDRKKFRSPICFLPEPYMTLVAGAVEKAVHRAEKEGGDIAVEFAVIVGIKPAKTQTGYEYTCEPLIEQKASDRLSNLRNVAIAALPAPQKAA